MSAGIIFAFFIFFISIMLKPMDMINTPPTPVMLVIIAVVKTPLRTEARSTNIPWYRKIATPEKTTPMPSVEAKAIDITESSMALVNSIELSPNIPAFIEPTIPIEPMQNIRVDVTNPSINVDSTSFLFLENIAFTLPPRAFSFPSISKR